MTMRYQPSAVIHGVSGAACAAGLTSNVAERHQKLSYFNRTRLSPDTSWNSTWVCHIFVVARMRRPSARSSVPPPFQLLQQNVAISVSEPQRRAVTRVCHEPPRLNVHAKQGLSESWFSAHQ